MREPCPHPLVSCPPVRTVAELRERVRAGTPYRCERCGATWRELPAWLKKETR